ncbi:DNA polymerase alpha subunit B-like [Styela clava]
MADTTADDVKESLSIFDINVQDDGTLEKMLEIATLFNYDADSIVNEWLAYQSTHGCKLSIENLDKLLLEKTVGKNRSKNSSTPASNRKRNPLVLYTADNIASLHDSSTSEDVEENDLLSAYGTPNRVNTKQKRTQNMTPKSAIKTKPTDNISASPAVFSPSSFSPGSTSSQKYTSRSNSGSVLDSFGPSHESITNHRGTGRQISIVVDKKRNISKPYKYMFQKLVDLSDVLDEMIENAAETIQSQNSSEIDVYSPCSMHSQEPVHIVGRICCDSSGGVGRLNSQSVLLQGDRGISSGKYVAIDLSQLEEFSLFPGQIVAMQGINPTGKKFIATKVYAANCDETNKRNIDMSASDPLSLLIAAGPFTTSDCLSYEPLHDLITIVKNTRPDVTVIIGPILDNKHDHVKSGKIMIPFEEVLEDKLNFIVEAIGGLTHLVIASSTKEASCHPVYPQPPYLSSPNVRNVHFVGDPSILEVDGLKIVLTSNDILFHLGGEEISKVKGQSDRLGRLAGHILQQKSFYPLYPSNESVNVDWIAAEQYGAIPQRPDIAILPSDLKCFIKNIDGCVCINPGRLAKGMTGGTFTQILVEPAESDGKDCAVEISAQIVKI